ncbi:YozE family protein [Macrococcoides caseolyticum]|uniref:YozE family protein n=1 Tax=Macrococcoides caseolyticum TaxID=69966 RepID=UPI001F362451|nr:YozE family protein [Macrococcus caseolyticus]MCE4957017.1 YozE family protein [Macrococcus caseolyticus]
MKQLSFYHYALTERGSKTDVGQFAEAVFEDLLFPKHETDFNALSTYIEEYGSIEMSLATFDKMYEAYLEWLNF